jgi:hypothetical protein
MRYHAAAMPINDSRAKQAMYMSRTPAKSSMGGFGSGRAITWGIMLALAAAGAVWLFFSLA